MAQYQDENNRDRVPNLRLGIQPPLSSYSETVSLVLENDMVDIAMDEDSFVQLDSSDIDGVIYWNVSGEAFPDGLWHDNPVLLLSWWATAAIRLITGDSRSEFLDFADGPYGVECRLTPI